MQSDPTESAGSIAAISLPFLYYCVNCMRKVANGTRIDLAQHQQK